MDRERIRVIRMKHERNTDDSILSQLMAEAAEEEGARLWQEYREAEARGEVPPIPEELDRRCRQQIHREFNRQHAEALGKPLLRLAGRAAAAVIAGAWFDGGTAVEPELSEELLSDLEQETDAP